MRTILATILTAALLLTAPALAAAEDASTAPGSKPLEVGQTFPDVAIVGEHPTNQLEDLGIAGMDDPTLADIEADGIIAVVYSMYCPFCQMEAPVLVEMYGDIARRGLEDELKIVGLAAGNSQAEVEVFRDKYDIPFLLVPDYGYDIHKQIGEVGTPFFYVLERTGDGWKIVHTRLGRTRSAANFLDTVSEELGYDNPDYKE